MQKEGEREREGRRSGEADETAATAAALDRQPRGGGETPTKMMFGRIRREEVFSGNG